MPKYKISIPKWEVEIEAEEREEAIEKANELYDDHQSSDPCFGDFIIEKIK